MSSPVKDYNREYELKAFDDSKAGVKGIVDSGIKTVPQIFVCPPEELAEDSIPVRLDLQVPVIDLGALESDKEKVLKELGQAYKDWGFFQVVNHGIPLSVLDGMIEGVRLFHEQDAEVKKEFYSRDLSRKVRYKSNSDLYRSRSAHWRDTLNFSFVSDIEPEELPKVCR